MTRGREKGASDAPVRLLDAAVALLCERRPADVTVRAVAERAGLQHSQITRYYGSRDTLLGLAVAQIFAEVAAAIDAAPDLDAAVAATIDRFVASTALTSAVGVLVAQGVSPSSGRYPIVESLEAKLLAAGAGPTDAREVAVALVVTISGWASAEPWWLRIAGEHDPAAGRRILERAVRAQLADAGGPAGPGTIPAPP